MTTNGSADATTTGTAAAMTTDAATKNAPPPIVKEDTSARVSEDGRLVEVGRMHPSFHYPVVKVPTGRVQFAINRAEVVSIDGLGDVRRGQVIAAKNLNFLRGLVASGNFAHCAADTPLGQPEEYKPGFVAADSDTRPGLLPLVNVAAPASEAQAIEELGADPLNVNFDFNSEPPSATFTPLDSAIKRVEQALTSDREADPADIATLRSAAQSAKKSSK